MYITIRVLIPLKSGLVGLCLLKRLVVLEDDIVLIPLKSGLVGLSTLSRVRLLMVKRLNPLKVGSGWIIHAGDMFMLHNN